jgi:hypothetical protein
MKKTLVTSAKRPERQRRIVSFVDKLAWGLLYTALIIYAAAATIALI